MGVNAYEATGHSQVKTILDRIFLFMTIQTTLSDRIRSIYDHSINRFSSINGTPKNKFLIVKYFLIEKKIGLKSGWPEKASPTTFSPSPTSPTVSSPSPEPAARKIGLARSGFGRPDPTANPWLKQYYKIISLDRKRDLPCDSRYN